ncbi:kinase-like protein [Lepidopterella palustris CBS 459.81]|uniref:Kinase-like protein n=1 Tax=Lepidopterella palustris CBS 459.81 TaxID=1314670 RepID=A0A8E2JG43_9PEZI|nr:kinase-like protein [Lepidopterella palustris CBS 459.81]
MKARDDSEKESLQSLFGKFKTTSENTRSYVTAKTSSKASFLSALSDLGDVHTTGIDDHSGATPETPSRSSWYNYLETRGMIPDPWNEMDWSGRGQHAEFEPYEEAAIPLQVERVLGHTASAIVESVMCRRIRLARKTVKCNRRLKREDALNEVEHLQRLSHYHLIRVIGTYTLNKDLSILLYPVAEYNLHTFMDFIAEHPGMNGEREADCLWTFFGCLSSAVWFLHDTLTKHMDIKPKNLLVKYINWGDINWGDFILSADYKIYIADFGIARSYQSVQDVETDSSTSFTRPYAAPEVVRQARRGLSADIFSLGCVFLEMLSTILLRKTKVPVPVHLQELRDSNSKNDSSYQANIPAVLDLWRRVRSEHSAILDGLFTNIFTGFRPTAGNEPSGSKNIPFLDLLPQMLDEDPVHRPLAEALANSTKHLRCGCCAHGPERLECAKS